jgi:hypothetical protein
MDKICTYLDLLGFSNYMNTNFEDAMLLVENYQNILQMGFSVEDDEFSSFSDFLPFSDSIFILSTKEEANTFIKDISHFLINCFLFTAHAYTYPIDKKNPTLVEIQNIGYNIEKKDIEVKKIEKNWYPTIFKGGVSFGDVETFSQKGLHDKIFFDQRNVAGKGIVSSVAMEKLGRGPRLFTDNTFVSLLTNKNRNKYLLGHDNISEILWPIEVFLEGNSVEHELLNNFDKLMNPAISLWRAYEKTPVGEIYFNLLKLITLSAKRYSILNDKNDYFIEFLKDYLDRNQILYFYDSLIDAASFNYDIVSGTKK